MTHLQGVDRRLSGCLSGLGLLPPGSVLGTTEHGSPSAHGGDDDRATPVRDVAAPLVDVCTAAMKWQLLAALTPSQERVVLAGTRRHRYAKGETLFHEGDLAEPVHFLQEGRVVSRRTTPQGDVATFAVLGPGEAFGEMAMLADDHRRTSTIVAIEPVITLSLRFEEFRRLCEEHPEVNDLLVRML